MTNAAAGQYTDAMIGKPDSMPDTPALFALPPLALSESPELAARLHRIDTLRTRVDALRTARPDLWPTINEKLRIFWTADSNAIEGSSLSRADTAFFLKEGLTVEGKPLKDFLDARNHADAIGYLDEVVRNQRGISPGLLKELNALLLNGVEWTPAVNERGERVRKPAYPGEYKTAPNHVLQLDGTIHHYVEPMQVPGAMEALCAAIATAANEGTPHPVIVSALAHYEFVRIHPFDDGNGRGARLLMNLILMRAGLPPAVIAVERRRDYLSALRSADRGDMGPFVAFVADSLLATQELIAGDFGGA